MSWTVEISGKDGASRFGSDIQVRVAGESLILLHERALFWSQRECLIIADLHWARTAAFLAASFSRPRAEGAGDLKRLTTALERTGATRLVLLGHLSTTPRGGNSRTFEDFGEWRRRHGGLQVIWVGGGRGRPGVQPPEEWRIQRVREPWYWKPFAFRHVPAATPAHYTWAGHLHPASPSGRRGRRRLPCFLLGERVGILPAFGSFGGSMLVEAAPSDKVFAIDGREVGQV